MEKKGLFVIFMLVLAFTVCAANPTVAEQTWEVDGDVFAEPGDYANEILNDSQQEDLIQLVVFAFTIGIIMTILGFAMGIMYRKR